MKKIIQSGLKRLLRRSSILEPDSREELIQLLRSARKKNLMDGEALSMMEGVLGVSELRVRDIMIPRANMICLEKDQPLDKLLPVVIDSAHSRFPVIGEDRSKVIGILLAKDLLQYCGQQQAFDMRELLRTAVFVPESKRLNILLKEFRNSRNHMAIVIDEYGAAAGLVTIEDVLEQIVGEIEDEYDFDEGSQILKRGQNLYTAKAHTTIEEFNEFFKAQLSDKDYDTLAGLVISALGHVPKKGEVVEKEGFRFTVMRADSRKVRLLNIEKIN